MVDLSKSPYNLDSDQIEWVQQTMKSMTLDEKIGQLFIILKGQPGVNEGQIKTTLDTYGQGGLRWQGGNKETVYLQNTTYQKYSKIPLLIAANCDNGGDGCLPEEGTFVSTAAQAAAVDSDEIAFQMGLVAASEATSIGCNWLFNPVADIYLNWRNTIVNTRCFGSDPETVIKNTRAFIRGAKSMNQNMACCAKHFPGDGSEELDQHLVVGINDLSADDWYDSYGKVYTTLIDDGLETIMVGHIAQPSLSRKLRPGIKDEAILPATFAPELLQDLLRGELGFNGLLVTDATHMIGFSAAKSRASALPLTIAAGCDMILFANDINEDIQFVRSGIEEGILSIERLEDAVCRILGLKAKLNLTDRSIAIPNKEQIQTSVNTEEFKRYRRMAADQSITLVKNTSNIIPVDPKVSKRVWLHFIQSTPTSSFYKPDPAREIFVEELERQGFEVTLAESFYDLEAANGPSPMNMVKMMDKGPRGFYKENYDLVMVVFNIKGYAQENNVRIRWSAHHSKELPWYISEVPTIGISLNFTNHLIDVPQIKTFINAFGSTRDHIGMTLDKICGKSDFTGKVKDYYFCDRWEARL